MYSYVLAAQGVVVDSGTVSYSTAARIPDTDQGREDSQEQGHTGSYL
jgi:hypothetical protein